MAREIAFPKTRHIALSALEQVEEAKAEGGEAILVPMQVAAKAGQPAAGIPLPEPTQPGAPGVPRSGSWPWGSVEPGAEEVDIWCVSLSVPSAHGG